MYVKHLGSLVFHNSNKLKILENCSKQNFRVTKPHDSICMKRDPHKIKAFNYGKINVVDC